MTVTWSARRNTRSMSCSTSSTGTSAEMLLDQLADAFAFGRGKARERLIEQQQARLGGQRQPHVDQPLAAVGQAPACAHLDAVQAHDARSRRRSRVDLRDARRVVQNVEALRMARLHGEADVLRDGQRREQVGDLERAADARRGDALGRQARRSARRPAGWCRASGGNMPETRLKAVVLPAPLGPISACSVRSRTVKSTPSTALMPPKCLTIPSSLEDGPASMRAGFRKSGSGASPILRPAMAASSTAVLRNEREHARRPRRPAPSARTG